MLLDRRETLTTYNVRCDIRFCGHDVKHKDNSSMGIDPFGEVSQTRLTHAQPWTIKMLQALSYMSKTNNAIRT